jgi:hypothetical protein
MATPLFRVLATRPDGTPYVPLASAPEAVARDLVDSLVAKGHQAEAVRLDAPRAWTRDDLRRLYAAAVRVAPVVIVLEVHRGLSANGAEGKPADLLATTVASQAVSRLSEGGAA